MQKKLLLLFFLPQLLATQAFAQPSIARIWNEAMIQSIREDFARPPVHARNLFHISLAMYDAWAAYDTIAEPYLLGKTVGGYSCVFDSVPVPADVESARRMAISYAAYRLLVNRFQYSPNSFVTQLRLYNLMISLGYDVNFTSTNYQSGNPAALGNYIAQCVSQMGYLDGSNEQLGYLNLYYYPVNPPLVVADPGAPTLLDPNRWQPLVLNTAIDQNGNPVPANQTFQSPEWGDVVPFALAPADMNVYERYGHEYKVYHDPGPMPFLDTLAGDSTSAEYEWNFALVSAWSSHLDPNDGVLWDISPRSIGNVPAYPQTLAAYHQFYDFANGQDQGIGRDTNPRTGQPYVSQIVPRGDYTRVLAQFWADGPQSETPPGHWFAILNKVNDHPDLVRRFGGKGPLLSKLEWDVKAYLVLGGAVHDAAISAWGIKGWYDGVRPISAIRYMAALGQKSDPAKPHYHPAGMALVPGLVELVEDGDPLAGPNNENLGKIKLQAWLGFDKIQNPLTDIAGVGWILAEEWVPYQRNTFVTPPFAGYISGHSTYSRSAAEALTRLTGDEYFPGGMGEFHIAANSNFLGLEQGPSVDVTLQWATYRDASDQTSLSRIWGGIHPPFDDIPGRLIGIKVGNRAFEHARTYFYKDEDADGFFSYEDCDDQNAAIYEGAPELCDGLDNDCNGLADDIPVYTYFLDADGDGFGDTTTALDTCLAEAPAGFVASSGDCNDQDPALNPGVAEGCDGLDNDCNGLVDDLTLYTYFADTDGDGYGDAGLSFDTCLTAAPAGFVANAQDCDDADGSINPLAAEACDGLDNDCNGLVDDLPIYTYFVDNDGDGYGTGTLFIDTCLAAVPSGFVTNSLDCDDSDESINPLAIEFCDDFDNDCNGLVDDGLTTYTYYLDSDLDGFGASDALIQSCLDTPPTGFASDNTDCNDGNALINPAAPELLDSLDNNCNGLIDDIVSTQDALQGLEVYPNPASDWLTIAFAQGEVLHLELVNMAGQVVQREQLEFSQAREQVRIAGLSPGLYVLCLKQERTGKLQRVKIVKIKG
ncbi:MAG: T9SS type A sorting domain-containing protein [Saprospiraceae bacterium]|nr:T9SS type A sorting domain-containing protein [Saprospiraceae bacterium]